MEEDRKRTQRNINPHAEAIYAMAHWGKSYSEQGGGSMDFWDKLTPSQKKFCVEQVKRITKVQKVKWIGKEIDFLEEWLEMYSEGKDRMLVCERDISDRIKELKKYETCLR